MNEIGIVTQITAIIAIVLSVLTLAWNIYKDGYRDRAKLKVVAGFRCLAGNGRIENDVLVYQITNTGGKDIRITHVHAKGQGTKSYIATDEKIPFKLEPGDFDVVMIRRYGEIKTPLLNLTVTDSLGREWHASKKDLAEVNKTLDELAAKDIKASWFEQ